MVWGLIMHHVRSVGIELYQNECRPLTSSQLDDTLVPVPEMLPEGGFEETFTEGPPEADLDTQSLPADGLFVRETDEQGIEESSIGDVPYTSCVRWREMVVRNGCRNVVSDGNYIPPNFCFPPSGYSVQLKLCLI